MAGPFEGQIAFAIVGGGTLSGSHGMEVIERRQTVKEKKTKADDANTIPCGVSEKWPCRSYTVSNRPTIGPAARVRIRRERKSLPMDALQAMRVFVRVVEAGSFTRAADSLGLPKGTVTKLIQALEARLRTRLLNRTTRRVTVTPDGAAYYERSARLINEFDEMEASITNAQASPRAVSYTHLTLPTTPYV